MAVIDPEDDFALGMQQKNHNQLLGAIDRLREAISQNNRSDDDKIMKAIEKNTEAIRGFSSALRDMKAPHVDVNVNHDKVIQALIKIGDEVKQAVENIKLSIPARKMKFKIKRDWYGNLDDVEVDSM